MGVEYSSALVVGLPGSEFTVEEIEQWVHRSDALEVFSPYFDAPTYDSIIGLSVYESDEYSAVEISDIHNLSEKVSSLQEDFISLTGKEGSLFLTPKGY